MKGLIMVQEKNSPFLQFDFVADHYDFQPLYFTEPEHVISTWELEEVEDCLKTVQEAVQKGFYVAGYMSYEAAYAFVNIPHASKKVSAITMPLIWFGVFKNPKKIWSFEDADYSVSNWELRQSKTEYTEAFATIKNAIEQKITDQVNYTTQFEAEFSGSAYAYYNDLKQAQKANYCAYLNIGDFQILSASPELFFHVHDGILTTKPMKGTIHRGKTYKEDLEQQQWLQQSTKNITENNLITEMMMEEMESVIDKGSIEIVNPFHVEKYPTVFQMTSTITGTIPPTTSPFEILKTLFPCGSITGVTKKQTMGQISLLEKHPRNVYCGTIGYITPDDKAVFNVPIRTVTVDNKVNRAYYGAGGAITLDSIYEEEYAEVFTKTKILSHVYEPFRLLETFGLKNGQYLVFDEHLRRLQQSAAYFDFTLHIESIESELDLIRQKHKNGTWLVQLLVDENGAIETEIKQLTQMKNRNVKLATTPIDKEHTFLYHKTTNRDIYKEHTKNVDGMFDILLWNENEEITEFTIGNVVVELNGKLVTPPVESGLLPGTFREKLLR